MSRRPFEERAPRRGGRVLAPSAALLACLALALVGGLGWLLATDAPEPAREGLTALAPEAATARDAGGPAAAASVPRAAPDADASAASRRTALAEADEASTLAQDAGRPLAGLVLAYETREPVAGATLRLFTEAWESTATSDDAGRFELRRLEGDAPALEVARAGFALARRPAVPEDGELVVELLPEARVEGVVAGAPPEALREGRALLWDLALDRGLADPGEEVALDAEGRFAFGGLRGGGYTVGVAVPGYALAYDAGLALEPGEVRTVALQVRPAASLAGVVHARGGEDPLAGVEVRVTPRLKGVGDGFESEGEVVAMTDAEGRYAVEGLMLGPHRIVAVAPWESRVAVDVVVEEEGEALERDLQLDLPASVSGSVLNGAGLGVAGAVVELSWDEDVIDTLMEGEIGIRAGQRTAVCDLNGRFRFDELPARRTLRVLAYRTHDAGDRVDDTDAVELSGRSASLRLGSEEEREGLTLRVDEPRSLRGRVADEFGRPLAGVELTVLRRAQNRGSRRRRENRETLLGHSRATSDEDGDFELVGLLPGTYELRAEGERLFPGRLRFGVPPRPAVPAEIELELRRGETFDGWVVDQFGDAVANAKVTAKLVRPVEVDVKAGRTKVARADAFGRFAFDVLDAGLWELRAGAPGYEPPPSGVLARTDAGTPVELELERTEPVGTGTLLGLVRAADDRPLERLRFEPLRGGVLALEDGRFAISGARAGEVRLRVSAQGYVPYRTGPLRLLADGELDLGVVSLLPAGTVRVFVKDAKGRPLKAFKARLVPQVVPGTTGALRLKLSETRHRYKGGKGAVTTQVASSTVVPLGSWRLAVSAKGHKTAWREVELRPGARSRTLEVRLQAAGSKGK